MVDVDAGAAVDEDVDHVGENADHAADADGHVAGASAGRAADVGAGLAAHADVSRAASDADDAGLAAQIANPSVDAELDAEALVRNPAKVTPIQLVEWTDGPAKLN